MPEEVFLEQVRDGSGDAAAARLSIPDRIDPALVTGAGDCVLREVERLVPGDVVVRGSTIAISGTPDEVEALTRLFTQLIKMAGQGIAPGADDVARIADAIARGAGAGFADDILLTFRGRAIRPKTLGQKRYIDAIRANTVTFCLGPAGTGKTYLAMAMAVAALKRRQVGRIVLTRPVVEAGESLGFLPGSLEEKLDPYVRPLYDALFDMCDMEKGNALIEQGVIEIAPLAFMRGRTFNDAFVILDEAQNTTPEQMKMFLTRLGFSSTFVITGDASQRDLSGEGGLESARRALAGLDGISFVDLDRNDIVRHTLVAQIVDAYARAGEKGDRRA